MADSYNEVVADGVNRVFTSPPYISKEHITVLVEGLSVEFTWVTASTVQTTLVPVVGSVVRVERNTPTVRLVDFQNEDILTEDMLDLDSNQLMYVLQEKADALSVYEGLVANIEAARDEAVAAKDYVASQTPTWELGGDLTPELGGNLNLAGFDIEGLTDGAANPTNLLYNGSFEDWYVGAVTFPTHWDGSGGSAAREGTISRHSLYSFKLTSSGTVAYALQSIHAPSGIGYWRGRTLTFSCLVYCSTPGIARIALSDAIGSEFSAYHTGDSTWQLLTVSKTMSLTAPSVSAYLFVGAAGHAYFDAAMCVEGPNAFAFSDESHSLKTFAYSFSRDSSLADGTVTINTVPFRPKSIVCQAMLGSTIVQSHGSAAYNDGTPVVHNVYTTYASTTGASGGIAYLNTSVGNAVGVAITSWTATGVVLSFGKAGSPSGACSYYLLFQG